MRFHTLFEKIVSANEAWRTIIYKSSFLFFLSIIAFYAARFVKEIVVARVYGVSTDFSIFVLAYTVLFFISSVFGNAFQSSFIPVFSGLRANAKEDEARRLLGSCAAVTVMLLLVLIPVMYMLAPLLADFAGYGLGDDERAQCTYLIRALLPFLAVACLNALGHGALQGGKRFWQSGLARSCLPLVTIIFVAPALGGFATIRLLVWGSVAGAMFELLFLFIVLTRRGYLILPRLNTIADAKLKRVLSQMVFLGFGALAMGATQLVDKSMASNLVDGSIAILNYGSMVPEFGCSAFTLVLGTILLPHFSELLGTGKFDEAYGLLKSMSHKILLLSIAASTVGLFASGFLVRLFFQGGNFDQAAALEVTLVQKLYLLQVPGFVLGAMGVRFLSAAGKNQLILIIAVINLALNIVLNQVLMQWLDVAGISLSTSIVYTVSCILIFMTISRLMSKKFLGCQDDEP